MQCSLHQGGAWRTQGSEVDSKTQHQWTKVQISPGCVHHWQYSVGSKELTSHFEDPLTNIQKALADIEETPHPVLVAVALRLLRKYRGSEALDA